jgi:hypothetical protein
VAHAATEDEVKTLFGKFIAAQQARERERQRPGSRRGPLPLVRCRKAARPGQEKIM